MADDQFVTRLHAAHRIYCDTIQMDRRSAKRNDARPTITGFDANVEIADILTRDYEVVVEVTPNRNAACQREPCVGFPTGFLLHYERITRVSRHVVPPRICELGE
jgi:hypothetical protein